MRHTLSDLLQKRILLLDGSMGVMLQKAVTTEKEIRGDRFATHDVALLSDKDILNLSRPNVVAAVHRAYLEAGADIIETNTFNSQSISQSAFKTEHIVRELNLKGVEIARKEVDRMIRLDPSRQRFVAGSVGPSPISLSLAADISDPSSQAVSFDSFKESYREQIEALIEGGADIILVETAFDLLNAKACLKAYLEAKENTGKDVPVIVSATVSDAAGRLLSGHSLEAFVSAVAFAEPLAVGLNCSFGPDSMLPFARRISEAAPFPVILYPNAGIPDESGDYSATPEIFCSHMRKMLSEGLANICGGCCGTAPEHIAMLRDIADKYPPRRVPQHKTAFLAGLKPFDPQGRFINVGERCNVAGSRKFLRLMKERNIGEAVSIARKQVEDGAMVLDINTDDALLDSQEIMVEFLRAMGADPVCASVPWMIDSSDFGVIEAALQNVGGKPVVNSISLKNGEEEFLRHARIIRSYGAAVVVMAFDEEGQAVDFDRKCAVCQRAYRLLTEKAGFDPSDIIFDPNILTIATGMPEHDRYALDYIRAVEWISRNLPGAKTSGGLSNLSFSFRGNDWLRRAMHSVFLHHAIPAGLSMAIMNPAENVSYSDIPVALRDLLEDTVLCRNNDATARLIEAAPQYNPKAETGNKPAQPEIIPDVRLRIQASLRKGDVSHLEEDLKEALREMDAKGIIDGPLIEGMREVGRRFESGEMFLPQVVKSAAYMHRAVGILTPLLEEKTAASAAKGKWILATVKGDVHDIGKNIAAVVLRCSGYEVSDLGVQVEPSELVQKALELKPDFIGLSGLITPSLKEMRHAAEALADAGIDVPLFIGGAATSEKYCALHIAPRYPGLCIRIGDASQNPVVAAGLLSDQETFARDLRQKYERLRDNTNETKAAPEAKNTSARVIASPAPEKPGITVFDSIPLNEIVPYINYRYLCSCWKVQPDSPQAQELIEDARALLSSLSAKGADMRAIAGIFPAYSEEGKIVITPPDKEPVGIEVATRVSEGKRISLADFVGKEGYGDHVGAFAVTIGEKIRALLAEEKANGDDYRHILLQSVCDRLAEATSEWLHLQVRKDLWGYFKEPENLADILRGKYPGIRPAIGYPSIPDQMQMHKLDTLLDFAKIGIKTTVNGALNPSSSIAGIYIASPDSVYF